MGSSSTVRVAISFADPNKRHAMELVVKASGSIRCLYDESINLHELGRPIITRASHVEPTPDGQWQADLSPASGPLLGPFTRRSDALRAESRWLEENWLSA